MRDARPFEFRLSLEHNRLVRADHREARPHAAHDHRRLLQPAPLIGRKAAAADRLVGRDLACLGLRALDHLRVRHLERCFRGTGEAVLDAVGEIRDHDLTCRVDLNLRRLLNVRKKRELGSIQAARVAFQLGDHGERRGRERRRGAKQNGSQYFSFHRLSSLYP
jgi:hypothetical protein